MSQKRKLSYKTEGVGYFEGHESTNLTGEQTKELAFIKFGSTYFIIKEMMLSFKDLKMSDYFDFTMKKKVLKWGPNFAIKEQDSCLFINSNAP